MSQTRHQIEALLESAGSRPRHAFGQNFMIDRNLVRLVAEAGEISANDCVIEVGPGTGTLTEELLDRAGRVIAVEIDRDLAALLRREFADQSNFTLIEGDALTGRHQLNEALLDAIERARGDGTAVRLVANLPYNIASPLVIELLLAGVDLLVFTVQKEVARRIVALPGGKEYGPLSVMAQLLSRPELLRTLPPQAFWPAPKVDSALVRLRRDDRLGDPARTFGRFVHLLFSFRRKTLRRALEQAGCAAEPILDACGFDGGLRAERFSPEQLLEMFRAAGRPRIPEAEDRR